VLINQAATEVLNGFVAYDKAMSTEFGATFKLSNTQQLKMGYWGEQSQAK